MAPDSNLGARYCARGGSERFIRDPSEVAHVGDRLQVRVLKVDLARKRISLSARKDKEIKPFKAQREPAGHDSGPRHDNLRLRMTLAPSIIPPKVAITRSLVNVLGVTYAHSNTSDGGDLYLTPFGVKISDLLQVENWFEPTWFRSKHRRLEGTSAVHHVPTKEVGGRSVELVVKNSRMGEDVPLETHTLKEFLNAEFNSPWEEFALVMEMREGTFGPSTIAIRTQEPLGIYVPPERLQMWQTGRSIDKVNKIAARYPGIDLDILRQYKLIYAWIPGQDLIQLFRALGLKDNDLAEAILPLTYKAIGDLETKGYAVADMKPAHIIVGEADVAQVEALNVSAAEKVEFLSARVRQGQYSVVDYELLLRTEEHDQQVKALRRHTYLDHMRDRFVETPLPSHLRAVEIMGVPYIWGHVESTGGNLWVVGRNPELYDYFLPERWRKTPCIPLSERHGVYYTVSKDAVHLVWKTSRIGEVPPEEPSPELTQLARQLGINSPFEALTIAQRLNQAGIPTVYGRAIYMTGSGKMERADDRRRYESHFSIKTPDGFPILREDRNYITIRGYFNGPDSYVASHDTHLYRPVDLAQAVQEGITSRAQAERIVEATTARLYHEGYDGRLLKLNDLIFGVAENGALLTDARGDPEARICNLGLIGQRG